MISSQSAKIAVFLSGGGSNLQALIDATKLKILDAQIVLVVSNMRKAFGLTRAKNENIDTFVFKIKNYDNEAEASADLMSQLQSHEVQYIALSGYLKLLPVEVITAYHDRITNIHPALLPKYGGKGMYGRNVHAAVLASGDKESGVTIHLANDKYDEGRILEQGKVEVLPDDTPESLAARVLNMEHKLYPRVLDKLIKGSIK